MAPSTVLCSSCKSHFSVGVSRKPGTAYVNGEKVYGCPTCVAWGMFDKWLHSAWATRKERSDG